MIIIKFALVGVTLLLCRLESSLAEESPTSDLGTCPNGTNEQIRECPKDEEFQCCGACEQLTCDKRYINMRCFMCLSDCYCKEGYIREMSPDNGARASCIPIEKCPAKSNGLSCM